MVVGVDESGHDGPPTSVEHLDAIGNREPGLWPDGGDAAVLDGDQPIGDRFCPCAVNHGTIAHNKLRFDLDQRYS
jgi:hypothetical protein